MVYMTTLITDQSLLEENSIPQPHMIPENLLKIVELEIKLSKQTVYP